MAKGERGQGEECLSRSLLGPNSSSPPLHTTLDVERPCAHHSHLHAPQHRSCHHLVNLWDYCKEAALSPTAPRAASQRAKGLVFYEQDVEMKTWVDKAKGKKGTLRRELDPRGPQAQQWICDFFWKQEGSA